MMLTEQALNQVDQHWAVLAVGKSNLDRAREAAKIRLMRSAVGSQMDIAFDEKSTDEELIQRVAVAYEVAAIEGMDALLRSSRNKEHERMRLQAQAGAFRAYELCRTLQIPSVPEERIFHILHLAALAYSSDQWTDLRRWLKDNKQKIRPPTTVDASWERRILFRLFDCWTRLLRKQGWDDLDRIREIVAGLRKDQELYEKTALSNQDSAAARAIAFRLIALYHWAKGTEILAVYTLQGKPAGIEAELDKHFEAGRQAAQSSHDAQLEVLLRWLHVTARRMVAGSLWKVAQAINSHVIKFVRSITKTRSLFELLPPQRAALQEQGLLDQASRAVVIDLPTSGGKTTLAQFRILQALNQFDAEKGWVAYVAPTRTLVAQLTRRFREDFSPLDIRVEQLTGAIEIDAFEEALLTARTDKVPFHILISTPEKLQLVIRNKKVLRPLALVVMDEAHNIEDVERGLRIEFLLATIKRECASANFLLLMPYVPNADDLAKWLGEEAGKTISIGTSPWQPNERAVGVFSVKKEDTQRAGWSLKFETLITTPKTIQLRGEHRVGPIKPLDVPISKINKRLSLQAGAMARVFSERGTSIAVAQKIPDTWSIARDITRNLEPFREVPSEIGLVQRFLAAEISPDFELINMLRYGVGVHHAGLSDETRTLIEWLSEIGLLRVLCATTTLAQGINFPVASIFLATRLYPYGKEMSSRAFWNLAGRAGRINQESVGIVGLAAGKDPDAIRHYVSQTTGELVSRLIGLLNDVEKSGRLNELSLLIQEEQWTDFRSYVAHLWNEKRNLDAVLADTEQLLRNTFGFGVLQGGTNIGYKQKAQALLDATRQYARDLAGNLEHATLADSTGFAPEGVRSAINGLYRLERKLTPADWQPESLFGNTASSRLSHLVGIMMNIPQIRGSLKEISSEGLTHQRIAEITRAWVNGLSIKDIAVEFFRKGSTTEKITNACKAIYKVLSNSGPWGLSALSKMPTSGIDFEQLPEDLQRKINCLPAMVYHGVKTEAAVLMRMNSVPRSIAEPLGNEFEKQTGTADKQTLGIARDFLCNLTESDWSQAAPPGVTMSGKDYKKVWARLSGEVWK
jgi:hypothetical protein